MEMNTEKTPDIQPLIKKRDALRHRMFLLILEIALWFGIPAFGAFFLGNYIDDIYGTGHRYLLIFLIIAFVLSWVAIIWRTKTLSKKLAEAEKEVREFKESQK
ncbi:MAG: hypothetical protein COV34_01915 [Candidatus Zambryskibacteria bacterium CG10_big_fil_rev_8_21_14_0_10_42_12]|uniref:AtpZ/AtpI family protein n=1 Tax=Candidatus Zambryskibacteria bacterium CG10_big_fil_rev_8_21_14_0_10_42_12 TaxID=1975115 RepID=A0A2H0QVP2_9BACT|nr:MAG: hypothetical protein COV34_01915 [Candidatus Zambryskibacteria bacterium CG10_big_fil_rev_8_21_14_0_10_42_12]